MKKKFNYRRFFEFIFVLVLIGVTVTGMFMSSFYTFKEISVKNIDEEKALDEEDIRKKQEGLFKVALYEPKSSFIGELTGYTGSCPGCSGVLACKPRTNVIEKGIYFDDKDYGSVRIVASSNLYPCGTIMKFNNARLSDTDIIAVVMDRGGAVKNNILDLLTETKEEAYSKVGRVKNLEVEVLRYGW
ncbi:MAG: 3D domain-containing protein [Bacilli bacterium]